jgi:two-component system response regulator YesN
LVDYLLPGRSGLEILRLTRERWPWIPTVIMTGVGSEDLAVEALRAGARNYLKKPIAPEELTQAVDALTTMEAPAGQGPRPLLGRRGGNQLPARSHLLHPAVYRAIAFVEQHFFEPITLADVARSVSLSKFHFCRAFRQETGLSFREHLRGLRIARAKTLLADTRLTITEIAFGIGFNDLSYFDKVFTKIVGVTPTDYREAPGAPPD